MRRSMILFALVLLAMLGAMSAKTFLAQAPALRTQSAAGEFDAKRAKARLAYLLGDQRPHPADSPADDEVRAKLVATLEQMGVTPIVRDQFACNELYKQRGVACARVRNVIAVLGPANGKSLLLNTHYDSTPVGPGAADAGIGVATLLEVAAQLKDERLKRPVILLFNEGEELGLVGARAFLADPLSRNVDGLVNLEARGVRGPVNMFETSRPNAAPIGIYSAAVARPTANSLSTDVYRLMPNYTDVNSFAERNWLTLNLAPIGNETRYHSPGDDIASLDLATLQHMGDQTLALARSLARGTPSTISGDLIFMDVAGRFLVTLPLLLAVILMVGLLFGLLACSARRGGYWRGSAIVLGTLVGSTALSWILLELVGALRHGMFWRAHPLWTNLATYASAIFVATILLAMVGRYCSVRQLRPLFWLILLMVGGLIGLFAPGGIIFFLFPPLLALIGMVAARWWKPAEVLGAVLAILFFYLTWGGMLALLEELLNGGPMWLFAPLGSLLLLPAMIEAKPLIDRLQLRRAAGLAGVLAVTAWAAAAAAPAYSADRQQRFVIEYVSDTSRHKSWWSILNDSAPLPKAFAGQWKRGELPFSDRPRWHSPATGEPAVQAPAVQLVSQVRNGSERSLTLRLSANGNDTVALVAPEDSKLRSAGLPGVPRRIDQQEEGKYVVSCTGRSCNGQTIELSFGKSSPVDLLVVGTNASLPASAAPLTAARPKFARPQYNRDESIAIAHIKL